MNKKLQVFISSTYLDLQEERQTAVEAVLNAGHIPAGMELFKAGNESQLETIKRWIDQSDVYCLLLGGRYGSLEPTSGKSYTQVEYEYALSKNMPTFALVITDDALQTKVAKLGVNAMERDNANKYKTFRDIVLTRICKFFGDVRDIKLAVFETLNEFQLLYDMTGWISGRAPGTTSFETVQNDIQPQPVETGTQTTHEPNRRDDLLSLLVVDPIEVEFGVGLLPLFTGEQVGNLFDRIPIIRRQLALELGLVIPQVRIRDNITLEPWEYIIRIRGIEVAGSEIKDGHWLAIKPNGNPVSVEGTPTVEPTYGLPAVWVTNDNKFRAEKGGYTVVDALSVVSTHFTEVLRAHAHELLTRQETKMLLDHVRESAPAAVDDIASGTLLVGQVQRVLANLLEEKISIRDIVTILETLGDYARHTKDPDVLTEYVRQALARQICHQFRLPGHPLSVITFAPSVEEKLQGALVQNESNLYISLDPKRSREIFRQLRQELNRVEGKGKAPILLTHPQLRLPVRRFIARSLPDLIVLSYNELDPAVDIESAGVINWEK